MANQRNPDKANISAYVDKTLKSRMAATGVDESSLVERGVIRELLVWGAISAEEITELAKQGKLRAGTVLMLRHEKLAGGA